MPSREVSLAQHRPDLSAWLDMILAKAVEVDADKRFGDTMELAFELEDGLVHGAQKIPEKGR